MNRRLIAAAATLASIANTRTAAGQTLSGRIVSRVHPTGVANAVVLVVDDSGGVHGRALSAGDGQFVARLTNAGSFLIRVRAIGVKPLTIGPLPLTRDTTLAISVTDLALGLPAITTRETTQCNLRPDSLLALGALWEDAKTALLASSITREHTEYQFDVVAHVRDYDPASGDLAAIGIRKGRIANTRSWVSRPPDELRDKGYVLSEHDSVEYVAPDMETLLSPYFAASHCFHIGTDGASDPSIRILFEPTPNIRHSEIRGALLIDRATHHLSALDFRYVNTRTADSTLGGHVEFTPLPAGGWVITDWWIRVPQTSLELTRRHVPYARPGAASATSREILSDDVLMSSHQMALKAIDVAGGTVLDVWRDSVRVWTRPLTELSVVIEDSRLHAPPHGGAVAYLVGTNRRATAGPDGIARFDGLTAGAYLVEIGTPELDLLGWPRARVRVDASDARDTQDPRYTRAAPRTVRLETPLVAARGVCGDEADLLNENTGVLVGTVIRDGKPAGGAEVSISYEAGANLSRTFNVQSFAGDGRFIVCGVPRESPIRLRAAGAEPVTARLGRADALATAVISVP